MIIHIVQPGETINSIANGYGINVDDLILENEITNPDKLVIGDTITIIMPELIYTVQNGDTIAGIAENYNITTIQLLRNNPFLIEREVIYPGEKIVIRFAEDKIGEISTFGYVYPFVFLEELRKSLPFLTYLTINSYFFTMEGTIIDIDDIDIIQLAKEYNTAPIMTISSYGIDIDIVHNILSNDVSQNNLINNIINIVRTKGYYGVNFDFFYILPGDKQLFVNFISKATSILNQEGIYVFVSLNISTLEIESGFFNQGYDFKAIGEIANSVLLVSHDFYASNYCIPSHFISFSKIQNLYEEIIIQIPRDKIIIEMSIIGYIIRLPYAEGETVANVITNKNAIELAGQVNAVISYDTINQVSSYTYVDNNEFHVVYNDERAVENYIRIIQVYGLQGIAIWNIMYYPTRLWLLINALFDIVKLDNDD